jgi:hypothetical protein
MACKGMQSRNLDGDEENGVETRCCGKNTRIAPGRAISSLRETALECLPRQSVSGRLRPRKEAREWVLRRAVY